MQKDQSNCLSIIPGTHAQYHDPERGLGLNKGNQKHAFFYAAEGAKRLIP